MNDTKKTTLPVPANSEVGALDGGEDKDKRRSGGADMLTQLRRKATVHALRAWREVKGTARQALNASYNSDLPREDIQRLRKQLNECAHGRGGEVSARARAVELGKVYLKLSAKGRERFLKLLAEQFGVDRSAVDAAITRVQQAKEPTSRAQAELALRDALMPDTIRIFRLFGTIPDGVKFLVDMRSDMLSLSKTDDSIKALEKDLKRLLTTWFDVSLLDMASINWESPAALLEKLIDYEAVHAIRSWSDLKNRLDSDRRCFAFFHNKMPMEPLIFVEVALVSGMADNVQHLLDESIPVGDPKEADTAIFYSISNAQQGLAGISFGNFLIKRVVDRLSRKLKGLKHFATLSPVPGFRRWLDPQLTAGDASIFLPAEKKELEKMSGKDNAAEALKDLLATDGWHEKRDMEAVAKPILLRLCAQYLVKEKRKGTTALDPVAHFHLTNGARLERINWLGDTAKKGFAQSAGIMVNYYYKLDEIDDNHETYASDNQVVVSRNVRALLK